MEAADEQSFEDAGQALACVTERYERARDRLRGAFDAFVDGNEPARRVRAHYPEVVLQVARVARPDSRLSFGFVAEPGEYATSLTRPDLFGRYYFEQFRLLLSNHGVPLRIRDSAEPMPLHFALDVGEHVEGRLDRVRAGQLRDWFDPPNLAAMDDGIANGTWLAARGAPMPLALFTAPRVDYSLHRLRHYCGSRPEHFQNYVLFTNYQFYIDEFVRLGRAVMAGDALEHMTLEDREGYTAFVEPGERLIPVGSRADDPPNGRLPQMPAYHLVREDGNGITMVNIGVGPANAKTITDHIAVLRPHAWLMLGHCAGLRNTQRLGDYVLAHGYVRDDHVLDADLPLWVPIPPLAEVQVALEGAVADVTRLSGYELKKIMRTGTVASVDNRNWELLPNQTPMQRLSQSRAIALDMESATIAANGLRFRVPYGTLLCVSDKPLHGEIKLPGMADRFYRESVDQHLRIGIRAVERIRSLSQGRLHSRKLRSFDEVAFQ
ncbi:MAG: AMP nucleosidase [Burkholderiaceae bacterium]